MSKHHNETYELALILIAVTDAHTRTSVLVNEKSVSPKARHWMHMRILGKLNAIMKDVKGAFDVQGVKIMEDDVLSPETALQLDEVRSGFLALSKERRDKIEALTNELLKEELADEKSIYNTSNQAA